MSSLRILGITLWAVATALVATACSTSADPNELPDNTAAIELQLRGAEANGADSLQISVLKTALANGEVTYEQVATLYEAAKECLNDSGFTTTSTTRTELLPGTDLWIPTYLVNEPPGMSDSAVRDIMTECDKRFVMYAASAYMDQPVNIDKYNSAWDTPAVRECLAQRGYLIDPDATGAELNALAGEDLASSSDVEGWFPCLP